jgi:hypothetical protein
MMATKTLAFDSPFNVLEGKRIERAYWLADGQTVLLLTSDRLFLELRAEKDALGGSGKTPQIWQVDNGRALQDASLLATECRQFHLHLEGNRVAVASIVLHTHRGDCRITATLEQTTDDNMPAFALIEYIGYPPETATRLAFVYNGQHQENKEDDPCLN